MASSAFYSMYDADGSGRSNVGVARRRRNDCHRGDEDDDDDADQPGQTLFEFLLAKAKNATVRYFTLTKTDKLREGLEASMATLEAEVARRQAVIDALENKQKQKLAELRTKLARQGIRRDNLRNLSKPQLIAAAATLLSKEDAADRKKRQRAIAVQKAYLQNVNHFLEVLSDAMNQCAMEQMSETLQHQLEEVASLAEHLKVSQVTKIVNGIHHKISHSVAEAQDSMMEFKEENFEDSELRRINADRFEELDREEYGKEIGSAGASDMTEQLNILADMLGDSGDRDVAEADLTAGSDTADAASAVLAKVLGGNPNLQRSRKESRKARKSQQRQPMRRKQPLTSAAAASSSSLSSRILLAPESDDTDGLQALQERFRIITADANLQPRRQKLLVRREEEDDNDDDGSGDAYDDPDKEEGDQTRAVS